MIPQPPATIKSLLRYLSIEAPGGDQLTPDDLRYLGYGDGPDGPLWIWQFVDSFGTTSYVTAEPYLDSYLLGYTDKLPVGFEPSV